MYLNEMTFIKNRAPRVCKALSMQLPIWKMLWPERLLHMQKSCRPNLSSCETTFDLRSNSFRFVGASSFRTTNFTLLRVAVRRGLELSGTHQHHSKLRRMEVKFWIEACLWHPTYCANCPFLKLLLVVCPFERLRRSQGSEPWRFLSFPPQQPLLHGSMHR